MMWLRTSLWVLTIIFCTIVNGESPETSSIICPPACRCFTTDEGLHKATCFSTSDLRKYSLKNKHHNINILDLSYSNISKLSNDLDKFTEVVSLDLSFNNLIDLKKLLQNSKKLVYLNMKNNLLKTFSASVIPTSVSSLNLQNNCLENVPSDLNLLRDLEHLELKGNPIQCSCENLKMFNKLLNNHIVTDDVKCASPPNKKGKTLSTIKLSDVCSKDEKEPEFVSEPLEDMYFGDEALDTEIFGPISSEKKSMQMSEDGNLIGDTWEASGNGLDKDNNEEKEYYPVFGETSTVSSLGEFDSFVESSGDFEDQLLPYKNNEASTNYSMDELGSGESGSGKLNITIDDDDFEGSGDMEENITTTTEIFFTDHLHPFFIPDIQDNNETVPPFKRPDIFMGTVDWEKDTQETTTKQVSAIELPIVPFAVTPILQESPMRKSEEINLAEPEETKQPVKTSVGTYICIGIIIALLVGLISLSVIKGRVRKNRDRRLLRQQKRDIEKGEKEMVDMNKSLLGKPLNQTIEEEKEKKLNGNYELVPTHETFKKPENGNALQNSETLKPKHVDQNNQTPNKSEPVQNGSRKSGNISPDVPPVINTAPLKSESDSLDSPHNLYPENNLLYPTEYSPVYNPDMGRVKIKLSETPKPKTPVLINRSRSNAGDIIITPAGDQTKPLINNST